VGEGALRAGGGEGEQGIRCAPGGCSRRGPGPGRRRRGAREADPLRVALGTAERVGTVTHWGMSLDTVTDTLVSGKLPGLDTVTRPGSTVAPVYTVSATPAEERSREEALGVRERPRMWKVSWGGLEGEGKAVLAGWRAKTLNCPRSRGRAKKIAVKSPPVPFVVTDRVALDVALGSASKTLDAAACRHAAGAPGCRCLPFNPHPLGACKHLGARMIRRPDPDPLTAVAVAL